MVKVNKFVHFLNLETGGIAIGWSYLSSSVMWLIVSSVPLIAFLRLDCGNIVSLVEITSKLVTFFGKEPLADQRTINNMRELHGSDQNRGNDEASEQITSMCQTFKIGVLVVSTINGLWALLYAIFAFKLIKAVERRDPQFIPMMIVNVLATIGCLILLVLLPFFTGLFGAALGLFSVTYYIYCFIVLYSLQARFTEEQKANPGYIAHYTQTNQQKM